MFFLPPSSQDCSCLAGLPVPERSEELRTAVPGWPANRLPTDLL